MKQKFIAGAAILLPILLTITVLSFIINAVTAPFQPTFDNLILNYNPDTLRYFSKIIILFFLLLIILLFGILGRMFFITHLLKFGNILLLSIPYLNNIYSIFQEVVGSLLSNGKESYSNVVFVPFPIDSSLSMGLMTKEAITLHSKGDSSTMIPVFIPGTPNPSAGYIQMFNKSQIILSEMSVSDGMKYIVSLGTINQEFQLKDE